MINDIIRPRSVDSIFEPIYRRGYDWKLIFVGFALIVLGQIVLIRNDTPADDGISSYGRFFLILGFFVVAIGAYFFDQRIRHPTWRFDYPRSLRLNFNGVRRFIFIFGLSALAFLTLRLLGGSTSGNDIGIWIIGIAGVGFAFAPPWLRFLVGCRTAWRTIRFVDVFIVGILVSLFLIVHVPTLTDWYYAAIGDEFGFYELGSEFANNGISAPFSQQGVDDYHPRLGMLMKSVVMDIVGTDHFGWKFSSVIMFCLTIPGVYVAGSTIGGRVAGAVAAVIFGSSHYLAGFTHIGYDHIDSFLPATWSVMMFLVAARTRSPFLYFIAGLMTGFCIYTNIAARVIFPTIVATGILQYIFGKQRTIFYWAVPWLIGCSVAAFPILLVDGYDLLDQTFGRVIGGQAEISELTLTERLLRNIHLNLYAFNFNEKSTHYVSGSLLDPISGILAVTSAAFAVGRFRDHASSLLIIWLILAFVATGGISPYDWHTAVTRLFPMMLPLSLLIGLFVSKVIWPIDTNFSGSKNIRDIHPKFIVMIGVIAVSIFIWQLNYQRSQIDTPKVFHNSPATVSIGAMRSEQCDDYPAGEIAFVSRDEHLVRRILASYDPGSVEIYPGQLPEKPGSPLFLNHQQAQNWDASAASQYGCIIFSHPWEPEPTGVLLRLRDMFPSSGSTSFSDQSGKTTVSIFRPK